MNFILMVVIIALFTSAAFENRKKYITIYIPVRKIKKQRQREFKSFLYIETSKGVRCIEEAKRRIV